ncbi:MAG: hypothetical protein PHI31_06570 [Desulfuromonadaceae bacterium]|nr:hypothetical protein [Desulfuromonadaceae bacterium]
MRRRQTIRVEYATKFNPGKILVSKGVNDLLAENEDFPQHVFLSLNRHLAGDWGDLCEDDREANETALLDGERLFSAYKGEEVPPVWIITERDRSVTTILFPDEY